MFFFMFYVYVHNACVAVSWQVEDYRIEKWFLLFLSFNLLMASNTFDINLVVFFLNYLLNDWGLQSSCVCAAHVCIRGEQVRASETHDPSCLKFALWSPLSAQRSQRPHQTCDDVNRDTCSSEASITQLQWRQNTGRLDDCAMDSWSLSGMGFHPFRHVGYKPSQHSCCWSGHGKFRCSWQQKVQAQHVACLHFATSCRLQWRLVARGSANQRWLFQVGRWIATSTADPRFRRSASVPLWQRHLFHR